MPPIDSGKISELVELQNLRGLPYFAGLQILIDREQLAFATLQDGNQQVRCWIITDPAQRNAQARRLDGKPWQSLPKQPKAKTLAGSEATWPIGADCIKDADTVYFCEGGPDLLAAATLAAFSKAQWAAVTMIGGGLSIHAEALPLFAGKQVCIFSHHDQAGIDAARNWAKQLTEAGAIVTGKISETPGNDLNDALTSGEITEL